MFFSWEGDVLLLNIRVQPGSSKDQFTDILDNQIKLRITAPPVDGKANSHIISLLSRLFKVKKADIEISSGVTSKNKRVKINCPKRIPSFIDNQNDQ